MFFSMQYDAGDGVRQLDRAIKKDGKGLYLYGSITGHISGETFLKKGSPTNPFPKTFSSNFAPMGYSPDMKRVSLSFQ